MDTTIYNNIIFKIIVLIVTILFFFSLLVLFLQITYRICYAIYKVIFIKKYSNYVTSGIHLKTVLGTKIDPESIKCRKYEKYAIYNYTVDGQKYDVKIHKKGNYNFSKECDVYYNHNKPNKAVGKY